MTIEERKERLMRDSLDEMARADALDFRIPMELDLGSLCCVVAGLQLALRHPANTGPSTLIVAAFIRAAIDRVRESGYNATADVLALGGDPAYDDVKGREATQ